MRLLKKISISIIDINNYDNLHSKTKIRESIFYFILLITVFSIIGSIFWIFDFMSSIDNFNSKFDKNFNSFKVKNSQLSVNPKIPIKFKLPNSLIIIDTTSKTTKRNPDNTHVKKILFTKDTLIIDNGFQENKIPISSFPQNINKDTIKRWLSLLKLIVFIFPVVVILFYLVIGFIFALVISFIGLIINNILKAGIKYGNIFKLTLYAMSLPIILTGVKNILSLKMLIINSLIISLIWYCFFIILSSLYLYFGFKIISKNFNK